MTAWELDADGRVPSKPDLRQPDGGVLEHVVVSGDPDDEGRLIGLADPSNQLDLTEGIVAAVPAGGCAMHLAGTPHDTAPNGTVDRGRRAYIFDLDPSSVTHSPIEPHLRQQ